MRVSKALASKEPPLSHQINGVEPPIIGKKCQGFYLIQYQENNLITDPANTVFLKFDDVWFRLYFDGNTIFWRESIEPEEPCNANNSSCSVLVNLCGCLEIVDCELINIIYSSGDDFIEVKLQFNSGKVLLFKHFPFEDYTIIES